MTRKMAGLLLLWSIFSVPADWRTEYPSLFAQEQGSLPERILNPLPDYDPFEKPAPAPRYFPDEVDKRVRQLLIDALTGNDDAMADHLRFFAAKDAELKKERNSSTGLSEDVVDFYHNTIRDRSGYLAAQAKGLATASPRQKPLIESRLRNDDLTQAQDLLKASSANKWGGVLNRFLSSVDLVSILSGSYTAAAIDTTMAQIVALISADMPTEERRALAHLLEHLKRYPDDPQNREVRMQADALLDKKKKALARKQIEKAKEAADSGDLDRALFHYEIASSIEPSPALERGVEEVKSRISLREEERQKGLSAAKLPDNGSDLPAERNTGELLYALALGDTAQIKAAAAELEEGARGTPLANAARDALAAALESEGRHDEAKKILQQLASSSHSLKDQQRAQLLLSSPEYNLLASFQDARSRHRLETVKYVLLGKDFLKKNLLYATAPLVAGGAVGAASVAAANTMMMGAHLVEVLTSNPISYQPVIDKAVDYIRSHPQSEGATEVYTVLANAYEQAGMYDRAISYLELSGKNSENKITELKDRAASALFQRAEQSNDRNAKEAYLRLILEQYPDSQAVKMATRQLAALMKSKNQGLRLSKRFLMENPELYGPNGLRLKATLFDGNLSNMELADRGVNLVDDREIRLHFQSAWGVQSQVYPIEKETTERLQIALRQKNYEVALGDVHTRSSGTLGGIKDLPPAVVKSAKSLRVADSDDTDLTLVQEATGGYSGSQSTPGHQLLTDDEKNPGSKFKLPPIQGSVSPNRVDVTGALPVGLWGDRVGFGADERSPFAGVQLPVPLIRGFIPVDFIVQGRPGRVSLFPKIHLFKDKGEDPELFR
ncbi:MAG: hypothetical protein HY695_25720 [Deltaproteobacteria bacterium]|nr:hypothetical protein [Deltaproteobacteria bacterium]